MKNYVHAAPGERSFGVGIRARSTGRVLRDPFGNPRREVPRTARPRRDVLPGLLSISPTRRELAGGMRVYEQAEPRQYHGVQRRRSWWLKFVFSDSAAVRRRH